MEEINKFSKGVNYDSGIIQSPPDTATFLQNWVQISDRGYMFSLQTEKGPKQISVDLPSGFKVIGTSLLDNDIIILLAHPDGYSQIGIIGYNNVYTRIIPNALDVLGDQNSELGLDLNYPVDCISRKLIKGDRILYYTDNHTPFAAINLDQTYVTGDIKDNIKIIPNVNTAIINFTGIVENQQGSLTAGVYQFLVQYQTASGNWTTPGIPSNIIPLIPPTRSVGRDKYEGGAYYTIVNKGIEINVTNIDQSFKAFRIIAINYEGNTNTFNATASSAIPVTGSTYSFIYTGPEQGAFVFTKEEITAFNITYSTAKAIEQKDQTLILSNLTESSAKFDHVFQDIANNITVKYKITEQEYLEGKNLSPTFASVGFSVENQGDTQIKGLFNEPISYTINNSDINVVVPANRASVTATITSFADLAGDSLNINGTLFTAQSTPATPGTATFQYSIDNNTTAKSLYNQINAYTFSPRPIIALINGAVVTIIDQNGGTSGNSNTLVYNNVGSVGLTISSGTFLGGTNSRTIIPTSITIDPDDSYKYIITLPEAIYSTYGVYVNLVTSIKGDTYTTAVGTLESIDEGDIIILENNLAIGISNYKDELNTFNKKGYRRSERYSLGIVGELKENSFTLNYHIPGNNKTTLTNTAAIPDTPGVVIGNTEGVCGTYVSTLDYPFNQFYPGNLTGDDTSSGTTSRKIRHHVMPSLQQEPSFRRDSVTGKLYIRILSLKLVFNKAFTPELTDALQAYYITRQSREGDSNTSVFAQGIIDRLVESTLDYDSTSGNPTGDVVKRKMPGFNNTTVVVDTFNPPGTAGSKPSAGFGFYNPTDKQFIFLSPDTLFERINADSLQGLSIKAELKLIAHPKVVAFNPSVYNLKNIVINTTTKLNTYPRAWFFASYNDYTDVTAEGGKVIQSDISEAKKIDYGTNINVASFTNLLYNSYGEQDTFISTVDSLNLGISGSLDFYIQAILPSGTSSPLGGLDQNFSSADGFNLSSTITNNIYNIYSNNVSQYGTVSSALYIPVQRQTSFPTIGSSIQVYGGDTFITRFAYSNKDNIQFKPYKYFTINATGITTLKYEYNGSGVGDTMVDATGFDIRSLSYFFVESNINSEYRHQFIDQTTSNLGPVFYPKGSDYDTLKTDPRVGEPNSYNTQYSFENKIKLFVNKSFDFKVSGRFENRSIYSEKANLDDIIDHYKEFPVNNFHDIPSNTGEIWDSFVFDNILYLHTPKALWRTYFNNNTFVPASDVSEVVLGTGAEFSRPSEIVITTKGGYAGTISQFGGCITSFGYVFTDALQGKVFLLGSGLEELSDKGAITFFKNIGDSLKLGNSYIDNPFITQGISSVYDSDLRRLMITKTGVNGFTISFSLLSQSWMGTHTYKPNVYISSNKQVFIFNNENPTSSFWELNKGEFGNYYGTIFPSIIEFNLSTAFDASKVFTNLIIDNQIKDSENNKIGTFTQIQGYNDFQNTGLIPVVVDNTIIPNYDPNLVQAKYLNKEYRLRIPRDIVIDPTQDIFDPSNLNLLSAFKKKLKGKWVKIRLEYNNQNNYEFILNFVKSIFDQNYR